MLRVVAQFHVPGLNRLAEIGEEIVGEVEAAVRKNVEHYKRCVQVSPQSPASAAAPSVDVPAPLAKQADK